MTRLFGENPNQSCGDILTTTNGGQGLSNILQNLQDGHGNNSPAQISLTAFNFSRQGQNTFQLDGIPLTVSATTLNQLGPSIVSGTLIPEQIYSMRASSIQVMGAPGPNKIILINSLVLSCTYNSIHYQNGGSIFLQYSQEGAAAGDNSATESIPSSLLLETSSNFSSTTGIMGESRLVPYESIINSPVCITNDTASFSDGDSSINYYITYTILSLL